MIAIARTRQIDPREACSELSAALFPAGSDPGLLLFFCSSSYDPVALADALNERFAGVHAIGCTTAGEIAPDGYGTGGIVAIGFSSGVVAAASGLLEDLACLKPAACGELTQSLLQAVEARAPQAGPANTFALLLIDGMSQREEPVTRALQRALGEIVLFGGSAGDDQRFATTRVFHDGRFHRGAAVLAVVNTALPFKIFKTQHFVQGDEKLVVTEADTATRSVREINGLPAAAEYARIVGVAMEALEPAIFAAHPVVVRINGVDFVRSIQKANPDGGLTFFCAIGEGIVLTVAKSIDPVASLRATLEDIRADLGAPQLVLVCDCILRRLEFAQAGQDGPMREIFEEYRVGGFCTYGEQFCGIHVNQTLTGIAFGQAGTDSPHA